MLLGLYNHFKALTGSYTEAARVLRIGRTALYSRVKRVRDRMISDGSSFEESYSNELRHLVI